MSLLELGDVGIVRAVELSDVLVGQRPMTGGGCPRLRQHLRIVDRDLHDEVVLRRTRNALDDAQLVAVKPRAGIVDERPLVEPDRIDDERVALPAGGTVAVKQRLRILGVRASIGVDDAEVVEHFDELHQQSWRLNELDRVRVTEPDGWEAARNAIHRPLRQLALCRRHAPSFLPPPRAGTTAAPRASPWDRIAGAPPGPPARLDFPRAGCRFYWATTRQTNPDARPRSAAPGRPVA